MDGMNQMKDEFERFYQGRTVLITGHMGFKGAWRSGLFCNKYSAELLWKYDICKQY